MKRGARTMGEEIFRFTPWLSRHEAAKRIGMSVSWLDKERSSGRGPRYRTVGRTVQYTEQWIDDYLAGKERHTEDSRPRAA
jgi:hypothetical protein